MGTWCVCVGGGYGSALAGGQLIRGFGLKFISENMM